MINKQSASPVLDRISAEEALYLSQSDDLLSLGQQASAVRYAWNPEPVVTYVVDRNVNYTNICNAGCTFCAFARHKSDSDSYVLEREDFIRKLDELVAVGGTQVLLQGGHNVALKLTFFEDLFKFIKQSYPSLTLHALSPPEIAHLSRIEKMPILDVLQRLKAAGLDSIPGGGAEILVESVRKQLAAGKCSSVKWLEVMETAHSLGIQSSATMMFGHIESWHDRIEHLEKLRQLQDQTGGFRAFICWTFQSAHTELGQVVKTSKGCYDYLKTLAISRIYLDNFPHVQVSWVTQGPKVGQIALHFGGDDFGGTMMEENVVRSAGAHCHTNEEEVRALIRDAGFIPCKRNTEYQRLET